MTEPTVSPSVVDPEPDRPEPEPAEESRFREVFVVLTPGGRLLRDRHYDDADAAGDDLEASAVGGVVMVAQVLRT